MLTWALLVKNGRLIGFAALFAAVIGSYWWMYDKGWDSRDDEVKLAIAQATTAQAQQDAVKTASIQKIADDKDSEDDADIEYSAQLEKQLAAEKKKHPLPADCVLSPDSVRLLNSAGKAKPNSH